MMDFTREKPEWAELSEYLCEKAEGYVTFLLVGNRYCIPVTPDFKKAFGISRKGDYLVYKQRTSTEVKNVIQSIASALYLQMRDTVGAGISESLSRQLTSFLEEKLEPGLDALVLGELNHKLLPERSGAAAGEFWKCPGCGSLELDVFVTTGARLMQTPDKDDNDFQTDLDEAQEHDHDWGDDSLMTCRECGFQDKARQFRSEIVVSKERISDEPSQ